MGISNQYLLRLKLKNELRNNKDKFEFIKNDELLYGNFKYEVDGFMAYTHYDFNNLEIAIEKRMTFCCIDGNTGFHMTQFFKHLISEKEEKFLIIKGFQVYNIKNNILEKETILFDNSVIDDETIKSLLKFPNLKEVIFTNCLIKKECNFNILPSISLRIDDTEIESFRIFNDTKVNLEFLRVNVQEIKTGQFLGSKFDISDSTFDIEKLFLNWNFPHLTTFHFHDINMKEYQFKYLKYAAPKVEDLLLSCQLYSFKFLDGMNNLINCQFLNSFDQLGLGMPKINDKEELRILKERYSKQIESSKYQFSSLEEDELISYVTLNEILNICNLFRKLSYENYEKEALLNSSQENFYDYAITNKFPRYNKGYYKAIGDEMRFKRFEKPSLEIWLPNTTINMLDNFMYEQTTGKKIVRGIPYIYYIDGIPMELVYKKRRKTESSNVQIIIDKTDIVEDFIEKMPTLYNIKNLSFTEMLDILSEESLAGIEVWQISFLKKLRQKIIYISDYNYLLKYIDSFIEKQKTVIKIRKQLEIEKDRLVNVLIEKYDLFSKEEKKYLFSKLQLDWDDYIEQIDENEITININKKTNNIFSKINKKLKALHCFEINYQLEYDEMSEEEIKKLKNLTYYRKEN